MKEIKIFCAVVETGFIVERKTDENEIKVFGIVIWDSGFEKSKDPQRISIYSLKDCKNVLKVHKYTMCEFWPINTSIRINNHCDKSETPHPEDIIRKHIAHAEKRKLKWHNSEHFTYWCRYAQVDLTRSKHLKPVWNKLSEGSNVESKANSYGWKEKIRRYINGKGNVDVYK
ncbi:hypothetical protein QE152_g19599 [Popillia japonica]|uniref:Uncharacterized protein n=1 Tax=Popillia japonica TaxID=7064 RepID=A0AAW1KNE9_POPJA